MRLLNAGRTGRAGAPPARPAPGGQTADASVERPPAPPEWPCGHGPLGCGVARGCVVCGVVLCGVDEPPLAAAATPTPIAAMAASTAKSAASPRTGIGRPSFLPGPCEPREAHHANISLP